MKKRMKVLILSMILVFIAACNGTNDNGLEGQMYNDDISPFTNISSESTNIASDEFPHTKAVQIQEAKYTFEVDVNQAEQKFGSNKNWKAPGQPQADTVNEPENQNGWTPEPEAEQPGGPTQEEVQQQTETPAPNQEEQATEGIIQQEQQVIDLTNAQRRDNGLSDLQADSSLSNVARTKSTDMQQNNYFSHTSPTYGSPFDMIRDFGVSYNAAAENIAQGQQTPEQVMESWMNSEGHRQNIMNGNFTHIGVGYDQNGHHWTQMFISR